MCARVRGPSHSASLLSCAACVCYGVCVFSDGICGILSIFSSIDQDRSPLLRRRPSIRRLWRRRRGLWCGAKKQRQTYFHRPSVWTPIQLVRLLCAIVRVPFPVFFCRAIARPVCFGAGRLDMQCNNTGYDNKTMTIQSFSVLWTCLLHFFVCIKLSPFVPLQSNDAREVRIVTNANSGVTNFSLLWFSPLPNVYVSPLSPHSKITAT